MIPVRDPEPDRPEEVRRRQGHVEHGVFIADRHLRHQHPTGTGPFKLGSWTVGDKLVLNRNAKYWGKKAFLRKLIFRPIADNSARLQALQTGEIDG